MPLKKNTKTRTGSATAKSRRASVLKDDKVGGKRAPMVTALKENNRCLASALGKCDRGQVSMLCTRVKFRLEQWSTCIKTCLNNITLNKQVSII